MGRPWKKETLPKQMQGKLSFDLINVFKLVLNNIIEFQIMWIYVI
jgi:hypothetical protein